MVEDHTRIGVVDAVVDVVTDFIVAERLADDLRDGVARRCHQKSPRLGEDLDLLREKAVELMVDFLGKLAEFRHRLVIRRRKAATDVEQFEGEPARLRLGEDVRAEVDRLNVILRIGALAADVKRQPFHHQVMVMGILDEVDRFARQGAEFAGEFYHRPRVGHAESEGQAGVRRVLGDLLHLLVIVVGDQRLVAVELVKGLDRLDRIGVDDLVPDEILAGLGGKFPDVFVDRVELLHAGDVETPAKLVERLHDRRITVDLDGVVDLHARKVLAEEGIVFPQFGVVDDEEGRAMFLGEVEEGFLVHFSQRPRCWAPGRQKVRRGETSSLARRRAGSLRLRLESS